MEKLKKLIRDVPDFPKPGIVFKDLTPLWRDAKAFQAAVGRLSAYAKSRRAGTVAAVESRGFILGGAVAAEVGVGFVPIRKKGKLPWKTIGQEYDLEYGTDAVEVHRDALKKGQRVLVLDDLLATGGTAEAACRLIERTGASVAGVGVIVELSFLGGRARLAGRDVFALVTF